MTPQAKAVADATRVRLAWQRAVQEILGPEISPSPPEAPSPPWEGLLPMLCARYGETAGLGLGLRVGRAFARQMIPQMAEETALQKADFRFLPWPRKMIAGLEHLAQDVSTWFGLQIRFEIERDAVLWVPCRCPFAPPHTAHAYRCTPWEGFLQEMLYWLSGGRIFVIQPAEGRPSAFYIPQHPLH